MKSFHSYKQIQPSKRQVPIFGQILSNNWVLCSVFSYFVQGWRSNQGRKEGNYIEAAMCHVHISGLLAELLYRAKQYPSGCNGFRYSDGSINILQSRNFPYKNLNKVVKLRASWKITAMRFTNTGL